MSKIYDLLDTIISRVNTTVRTTPQSFSISEQKQARQNLGIVDTGKNEIRVSEINLLATKWVGSANLFSQVVNIEGVTKNSQVDLTPSVDQLVVFYEKDLTLVAEQENGVVTVYAIGQKPTNDYKIQVTITEVSA